MLRLNKYFVGFLSGLLYIYYRFIVSFPIGLDFLFRTFTLFIHVLHILYSCPSHSLFMSFTFFYHGHLLCRSNVRPYPLLHYLTMSSNRSSAFNSIQTILHTFLHPVLITFPHHMSITSQSTTSNESCDMLNSNQPSQFFIWHSVFQ